MNAKTPRSRFGIHCTLPPDDPMSAPHLLGPDWEAYRWYDSEQERDLAIQDFSREHLYSRRGDRPSVIYTKVTR
ncbi:MAG TPA: hypothetical protein VGO35_06260 [Gammaproteobacteria bacterium]|jgi:hypothetical protein|nr:hypothetical protein [Gammaproteobacteria bacterium]